MIEHVCRRVPEFSLLCCVGFLCGLIGCGRGEYDKRMENKIQQLRTQAAAAPVEEPAPSTPAPAPADDSGDDESADDTGETRAADTSDAAGADEGDGGADEESDESAAQ